MLLHIDIEDKVHYTYSFVKKNRYGINGEAENFKKAKTGMKEQIQIKVKGQ